jgi:hypothetical protein
MGKEVPPPHPLHPQIRAPLPDRCLRTSVRGGNARRYAPPPSRTQTSVEDLEELDEDTQQEIEDLVKCVTSSRPPVPEPKFPRRSVWIYKPPHTAWTSDEDKLLMLLRESGFSYVHIAVCRILFFFSFLFFHIFLFFQPQRSSGEGC